MRSIRLSEWALTILNETIRADAEFQLNQRNAWQVFAEKTGTFKGIDISAGFQHQRNLFMNEVTFALDLIPDVPRFWDKVFNLVLFKRKQSGSFFHLKKTGEESTAGLHVTLVIKRTTDNRYQSEVRLDPNASKKPEDIRVVNITR
jgi:hypothetical protein